MHIYWFGLSSFRIVSKEVSLFTDPFSRAAGVTPPRGAGQIVVSSNPDNDLYNNFPAISGTPFVINGPGEYDVQGIFIRGIPASSKIFDQKKPFIDRCAIYSMSIEGVNVGFLGSLNAKTLTDTQVEEMNDIDILLVPVGGGTVCDAEAATSIISQIEPKVIIPMHYKTPGISVKMDGVERFLKEMGSKGEELDKLVIKKNDLEEEKTKVVLLAPQRS